MMDVLLSAVLSGFVTWVVTHYYDRQAMVRVPGWARPLMDRLPKAVPSRDEFRELLQEVIGELEFTITEEDDEAEEEAEDEKTGSGDEECPKCGSGELEVSEEEDEDGEQFETVECLDCGWREQGDV